jgi:hypothetical protein
MTRENKNNNFRRERILEITPRNHAQLSLNYGQFLVTLWAIGRAPLRGSSSRNGPAVVEVA